MMRSPTLLFWGLFPALLPSAACQLDTNGQQVPVPDVQLDASTQASSTPCGLACSAGSQCELRGQNPVCVPFGESTSDAGPGTTRPDAAPPVTTPPVTPPVTTPPVTTPPASCDNVDCILGSQCVVGAQGPTCVPKSRLDAGTPPVACDLECERGRHCSLTAQGPSCIPDEPVLDAGSETPCGTTSCTADEKCCSQSCGLCAPRGSVCPAALCPVVDAEVPKQTCASASCPAGTYCDDITGSVECKPLPSCDTVKCTATTTCELVPVQCVRAPCPPQPQCVPKDTQVCDLDCKVGTHCVLAGNGPKCMADPGGMKCGKATCAVGQTCCNASCGACVGPGGACIQVVCESTD